MATLGTGSPLLYIEASATQTGASGTKRTVKIILKARTNGSSSASKYGYPCNWRAIVNGTYGSYETLKGTETWCATDSLRTFTQTLTVDVGTTNEKTITVGVQTNHSSYSSWNGTHTFSFKVGSTNVAPTLSGTITADGSTSAKYIPENQTTIKLVSPTASDKNLSGYRFAESKNGGSYSQIYKGSDRTYTRTITGGEGTTYKYSCYAYDTENATSSTIYSALITKNTFTGDTLSSSSTITNSNINVSFSYSGAKNTNGNTTFARKLTCSGITVYNNTITKSPIQVEIYKSGTVPTGPYIKFNDIVNKFSSSSYKGSLTFMLSTTNEYGTTKTSSKVINVNLQVIPDAVTGQEISLNPSESTMYRIIRNDTYYFVPDGNLAAMVKWNHSGVGKLGESVKYDVYIKYDSGSWQLIKSDLSNKYYSYVIPKQTTSKQFKFLVRTKCVYNTSLYSDSETAAQTLHYHNNPSFTQGSISRTSSDATVPITIKTNSSIINIETVGNWSLYNKGDRTSVISNGDLSITQNQQLITVTELSEDGSYDLVINYKDDTTISSYQEKVVTIGANSPVFFVNRYGAGVGGEKADVNHSLSLNGNIKMKSPNGRYSTTLLKTYDGNDDYGMGIAIGGGGMTCIGSGESYTAVLEEENSYFSKNKSTEHLLLSSDQNIFLISSCNTVSDKKIGVFNSSGNLHIPGNIYESTVVDSETGSTSGAVRVYSPNNKPTPDDIGAMKDGGAYDTVKFSNWVRTTGNTGWYSETHGGGIHMLDTTWVRVYNNKGLYTGGEIKGGKINSVGTANFDGLVTTGSSLQVGQNMRLGDSNKDVTIYSYWSDNAHHNWFDKSASDEIKFGPAKQTFDSTTILRGTCVRIYAHGKVASGTSGVFLGSSGSTAITSDENLKDVFDMDYRYMDFFDNLKPVLYKYKGEDYHRYHVGFGARATEKALLEANIPTEDFGGVVRESNVTVDLDGSGDKHYVDLYSLRYEEFIGLNTMAIKRNKDMIESLKNEIAEIKQEIKEMKEMLERA